MRKSLGLIIVMIAFIISGCSSSSKSGLPQTTTQPTSIIKQQVGDEYYFTQANQHPEKALIDVINSSKQTLDIAIYSLTHPDIVSAIKEANKRGVAVRIISDKIQSAGKTQDEALKLLGSAGIPMKINKHNGLMHLKVTIADKKVVTTGSYNYSQAVSTSNDEVLMVVHDEEEAKSFSDQFDRMWNDTKGFEILQKKIAQ
jgi:phosphatidylserine/phosphatidylglycerophosphate/cardiolipin synthase-like enzyme